MWMAPAIPSAVPPRATPRAPLLNQATKLKNSTKDRSSTVKGRSAVAVPGSNLAFRLARAKFFEPDPRQWALAPASRSMQICQDKDLDVMPLLRIDVNEGRDNDQLRNLSQAIARFADSTGGFSFADNGDSVNLPRLGKPCVLIPRSKKSGAKGMGDNRAGRTGVAMIN